MNLWVLVWLFAPQAIETHGQKLNKSIISMGMLNLMTLIEAKQIIAQCMLPIFF
jgi:hypothetical protein